MSNTSVAPRTAHQAYDYTLVDVFAERPLEGNQLAIFTDARGLTTAEMQSFARETNLSETTFILPRDAATERERGVQVRIFTVAEELRFAGHPSLGTASWLYWNHPTRAGAAEITLDLPVGPIACRFTPPERSGLRQSGGPAARRQPRVYRASVARGPKVRPVAPAGNAPSASVGSARAGMFPLVWCIGPGLWAAARPTYTAF